MDYQKQISFLKQRWINLLMPSTPGRKFTYIVNFIDDECPVYEGEEWNCIKERSEYLACLYEYNLHRMNWLPDDYIPCIEMTTGTEIFGEAFGCKVYRPENNMPFAIPLVKSASEAAKLKVPRLEDTKLSQLFEIADRSIQLVGAGALTKLPDMQCPMDIVATIWDKTDLFVAMIEEPEAVKDLCHKVSQFVQSFLDEWFRRYGKDFIAHHPDYYMTQGVTFSIDEVGSVSPALFKEFFLDELNYFSNRYGGLGFHCCANASHQWEHFKSIHNLHLINFNQPDDVLEKAYTYFAKSAAQMHVAVTRDTLKKPDEYPEDARVVVSVWANDKADAIDMSKLLAELYGRE